MVKDVDTFIELFKLTTFSIKQIVISLSAIDYESLLLMLINLDQYQLIDKQIECEIFKRLNNVIIDTNNQNILLLIDDVLKGIHHPEDIRRRISDSEVITTAVVSI